MLLRIDLLNHILRLMLEKNKNSSLTLKIYLFFIRNLNFYIKNIYF